MLPIALFLAFSSVANPPQASPVVGCDIDLRRWCIGSFEGQVKMQKDGSGTRWELRDPSDAGPAGITIIENSGCRTNDADGWSIIADDKKPGLRSYHLKSAYCAIDVSFPTKGEFASAYARFATYGIVLRDAAKSRSIGDRLEGRF